jgi:putative redox protein
MITLRMYAQHKQIDLGDFSVEAEFHGNKDGQEWIERRLSFQQSLSEELQQKVLEISEKTPVTKTLLRSLEIRTRLM